MNGAILSGFSSRDLPVSSDNHERGTEDGGLESKSYEVMIRRELV